MPTKIRLQRKGKKGMPFYHIVIADGRAPRDGKFIDKIGTYNPLTKPAEIDINIDRAVEWLNNGAQPTETVRAILSYKGVLYKKHLLTGVLKGALTTEQADMKFEAWQQEKQEKILSSIKQTDLSSKDERKKRLEAEAKVNEARAKELAAKRAKELEAMRAEAPAEAQSVAATAAPEAATETVAEAQAVPEQEPTAVETAEEEQIMVAEAEPEPTTAETEEEEQIIAAGTEPEPTVETEEEEQIMVAEAEPEVPSETEVIIPEEMPEQTETPAEEEAGEQEESKA